MAKLGDVCTISSSNAPIASHQIWLLNLDMVEQQTGNIISYNYVENDDLNGSIIQFDTDNVLYSKLRPNLNKVVIPKSSGFATSEMLPLKPDARVLSREYLAAYLRSDSFVSWAVSKTAGAKMPRLGTKVLLNKEIPLPPLEEQRRIAAVLDKVSDLIAKRRAQLDKLDLLVKARFVEMFGDPVSNEKNWPIVTLGDIAEIRIGPFGSLLHKEDYIAGGHALVNPSHIIDGQICVDENLTVSDEKYDELSAYQLRINDIALGRRGEMGRCAVVHQEGLLCGTGSMIIRPYSQMKPYFLQNIISNPAYKRIIEDKAVGVTMMNLNVPIVSALTVPLLPVHLQEQFIDFMGQVGKAKLTIQKSLDKLEVLKKALMQEHFG